ATCGAKNCCKRPIRSTCALLGHPLLEQPVPAREFVGLLLQLSCLKLRGIVQFFDAEQGADASHQCSLLEWLGDVIIAPCLETADNVAGFGFGRYQDDGYEARRDIGLELFEN